MNKKIIVYVIALLFALMFVCVVAFNQKPVQQKENNDEVKIENENNTKEKSSLSTLESIEEGKTTSDEDVNISEHQDIPDTNENTVVKTQNNGEEIQQNNYQDTKQENQQVDSGEYFIPQNSGFKSYMSYQAISTTSSPQYVLQTQYAYTGEYGIRQVDGRFCIAIGTFSNAKVGTYVDLVLQNGTVIPCVVGDFKADIHTDSSNMVTLHNGCVSEFIVDKNSLHEIAKKMGDISYCRKD